MAKMDTMRTTKVFVNKMPAVSAMTMLSANKLFKKCAKIGTRILSVFKQRIAMHIAKINAEVMLPKVCMDANSSEEISIANNVGTITFNLFNKTPLKINSSEMGEINTVVRKLPTTSELLNEK